MEKLILSLFLGLFFNLTSVGQDMHPDSVIHKVFQALTTDQINVSEDINKHLVGPEWEALAYWETHSEKKLENMFEAVGDIYQFQPTSFVIKLRNPENPREFLSAITGSYRLEENTLILKSQSGNYMDMRITYLDKNYLVLELEDMRIFFTKFR